MGLLARAIALSSNQQAREDTDVEPLASRAENDSGRHPQDIIDAFKALIGFTSGSIMLLDSGGEEYYTLIATGSIFSALGEPRIKSNLPGLYIDESDQITISKIEALIPNLSEVNPMEGIMVLRIGTGNPPSAILLATGYQLSIEDDNLMKTRIRQLADRLQDEIEGYRQVIEEKRETAFSKRLVDAGIDRATAVFLNLSDAIEAISESYSELDTHNATQKVNNLLERITGRMGRLYKLEDERVLIMFPDKRLPDYDLYLHQLSTSFGLAYKKLKRTLDFQAEIKLWPNDRTYIEKQLPS